MTLSRSMVIAALVAVLMLPGKSRAIEFDPYIGVGIGAYSLDFGLGSEYASGGYVQGGINFSSYFGIEARLGGTFGTADLLGVGSKVDWAVSILAKPQVPITGFFRLYGLLGSTTQKTSFTVLTTTLTNTSTGFTYGGGLEMRLTDFFPVSVEWVQYSTDADLAAPVFPGLDVSAVTVNFRFEF